MTGTLPKTTSGIFRIVSLSLKSHPKVFINVWKLLLASVLLASFSSIINSLVPSMYLISLNFIVSHLIRLFLLGLIFYKTYKTCSGIDVPIEVAVHSVKKAYFKLLGACYIIFGLFLPGAFLSVLFSETIIFIVSTLLVWGAAFLGLMLFMSPPLILLNEEKLWQSMENSLSLVWGNWWHSFGIIALGCFFILAIMTIIAIFINDVLNNFAVYSSLDVGLKFDLMSNIVNTVFAMSSSIVFAYLFNDLSLRKKEKDRAALISDNAAT